MSPKLLSRAFRLSRAELRHVETMFLNLSTQHKALLDYVKSLGSKAPDPSQTPRGFGPPILPSWATEVRRPRPFAVGSQRLLQASEQPGPNAEPEAEAPGSEA